MSKSAIKHIFNIDGIDFTNGISGGHVDTIYKKLTSLAQQKSIYNQTIEDFRNGLKNGGDIDEICDRAMEILDNKNCRHDIDELRKGLKQGTKNLDKLDALCEKLKNRMAAHNLAQIKDVVGTSIKVIDYDIKQDGTLSFQIKNEKKQVYTLKLVPDNSDLPPAYKQTIIDPSGTEHQIQSLKTYVEEEQMNEILNILNQNQPINVLHLGTQSSAFQHNGTFFILISDSNNKAITLYPVREQAIKKQGCNDPKTEVPNII